MQRRHLLPALLLGVAACRNSKPEARFDYGQPKERYQLRGTVLRLNRDERVAVVKHEKIEGWMEAMTMGFPVPDAAEFSKLKEGSKIRATVCVNDLYFWLTGITVE